MPPQECDRSSWPMVAALQRAPLGGHRVRVSDFEGELIGGTNSRLHLGSQGDRDLVDIAIRIAAERPEQVRAKMTAAPDADNGSHRTPYLVADRNGDSCEHATSGPSCPERPAAPQLRDRRAIGSLGDTRECWPERGRRCGSPSPGIKGAS